MGTTPSAGDGQINLPRCSLLAYSDIPKPSCQRIFNRSIANMRIAVQRLLNLQSETVHPTAHVRRASCQPDANTRRRDNHRRSTLITRRSVTRPTSCPTLTDVPSGSVISILPPEEYLRWFRPQHTAPHLASRVPQQPTADLITAGRSRQCLHQDARSPPRSEASLPASNGAAVQPR